ASDFFLPWNNNVLYDSKTNMIIQDGRAHLQLTNQKYDVIISEPSNPWMAGLAALFTGEFFALAEDGLNDNGIFVQFIHSYQMDWPTFALVGRTFEKVFPNSLLVLTAPSGAGGDYLLVGFKGKEKLILENAQQKLSYAQQSRNISIADPRLLYRLIVSEDLRELFGRGPVNTDNWPRLEYAAPKLIHTTDPTVGKNVRLRGWLSPETTHIVQQVTTNVNAQIDFAAYALSVYSPFPDMVDLSQATPSQKERFFKLVETYWANHPIDTDVFEDEQLKQRCCSIQIEVIEDNIDSMPDKALSYFYLATLYYEKGMLDEAIANCSKSLQINSEDAKVRYNLGEALARQGKFDEAVKHFAEALRIKPNFGEAHGNLACAFVELGKLDEAVKHFYEALRIEPDNPKLLNNLGAALAKQGRIDEAIKHYSNAVQIDPDFIEARNNLASALAWQGRLDQATKHFAEAMRIKPDDAKGYNDLGKTLLRQGKLTEAVVCFTQTLRIDPDDVDAHYNLGIIFARQSKFAEAVSHLTETLRFRPDFTDARGKLAYALTRCGRLEEAIGEYRKVLQVMPNSPDAHNNLGVALAMQGKFDDAIVHFNEALRINPDFADARRNLKRALNGQNKFDETAADQIKESQPDPNLSD
ncbi:MAG: tetratricopeptide repeat protein, partial [Planctomycetota bacterium]